MKKLAILFLILSGVFIAQAEEQKEVNSKVKAVTVFTNGAQVTRSGNFQLPIGVTELVFEGVSPSINAASLQAKGKGEFIILDVRHNIKYPEPVTNTNELPEDIRKKIKVVEDSLTDVNFDVQEINERIRSLAMEKGMITNNPLMKGGGRSDSIELVKDAMVLFRDRLQDINIQTIKAQREQHKAQQLQSKLQVRLNDLRNYTAHIKKPTKGPIQQVIVTVSAEKSTYGKMDVTYAVSGAGWVPMYDLRAKDVNSPVELTYKAQVYQNTGEEWKSVDLTLSSNNPNQSNAKPHLPVWYLNYYQPRTIMNQVYTGATNPSIAMDQELMDDVLEKKKTEDLYNNLPAADNSSMYSAMVQNFTNVRFSISIPYTIESDGKYHFVAVQKTDLKSKYFHYAVPRLDSDAFLIAKVSDWEKLNLLPGQANIFFDGTYIGQTAINPSILTDTLELAFGRDRGVNIQRTKEKDIERDKLIGSDKIKTRTYAIKVKNNHSTPINLVIEDQIPISQNEEIKVKLEAAADAKHNEKSGYLIWDTKLKAGETRQLGFSYTVSYDGNKQLSNL